MDKATLCPPLWIGREALTACVFRDVTFKQASI